MRLRRTRAGSCLPVTVSSWSISESLVGVRFTRFIACWWAAREGGVGAWLVGGGMSMEKSVVVLLVLGVESVLAWDEVVLMVGCVDGLVWVGCVGLCGWGVLGCVGGVWLGCVGGVCWVVWVGVGTGVKSCVNLRNERVHGVGNTG